MNRHLAHALGATALGALLLQPVTAMGDPPAHARNEELCPVPRLWRAAAIDATTATGTVATRFAGGMTDMTIVAGAIATGRGYPEHRGYVVPAPAAAAPRGPPPRPPLLLRRRRLYGRTVGVYVRRVDPPVGLVISFLPQFSTTLHVGGVPYYRAGPVYYVWNPRRTRLRGDGPAVLSGGEEGGQALDASGPAHRAAWRCAIRSRSSG